MAVGKMIFTMIGLCLISEYSDAAITGWTNPSGISAATGSGSATPPFAEDLTIATTTGIIIIATTGGSDTISTYALQATTVSGATFSIANAGLITFVSGTLDFETTPKIELVIIATDSTGALGTATATLTITNVDEPPYWSNLHTFKELCSGSGAGTAVETMNATDPESQTVVGYDFASGNTGSLFSIVATSGVVTIATGKTATYDSAVLTNNGYVLAVKANDGTNTGTATLLVLISPTCSSGVAALTVSMVTVLVASLAAFLK